MLIHRKLFTERSACVRVKTHVSRVVYRGAYSDFVGLCLNLHYSVIETGHIGTRRLGAAGLVRNCFCIRHKNTKLLEARTSLHTIAPYRGSQLFTKVGVLQTYVNARQRVFLCTGRRQQSNNAYVNSSREFLPESFLPANNLINQINRSIIGPFKHQATNADESRGKTWY